MFWAIFCIVAIIIFAAQGTSAFLSLALAVFVSTASVVVVAKLLIGKVSFENALKANILSGAAAVLAISLLGISIGDVNAIGGIWKLFAVLVVPFFVLLFVYSHYLESSMGHAFVVLIASTIVNASVLWFLKGTLLIGSKVVGT